MLLEENVVGVGEEGEGSEEVVLCLILGAGELGEGEGSDLGVVGL